MNPTDQQNQQQQPTIHQNIVIVGKQKSVGVAFILAFFFGPLGLLYASVVGGIVMFFVGIVIAFITLGFGLVFVWIGCIIWAIVAANNANNKIPSGITANMNLGTVPPAQQQNSQIAQQPLTQASPPHAIATDLPTGAIQQEFIQQPILVTPPPQQSKKETVDPTIGIRPAPANANNPIIGTSPGLKKNYLVIILAVAAVIIIAGGIYVFKLKQELSKKADSTKMADSAKMVSENSDAKNNGVTAVNAYNSAKNLQNGVFNGNNFQVTVPPDFVVKPSLRIGNAGYNSAFFESPDSLVEFYIFQSNYNDDASDIIVNPSNEKITSTSVQKENSNRKITTWFEIAALDNSYLRAYQDVEAPVNNLHWVVGLKYKSKAAYDQYKSVYLKFKSSYTELGGD